MEHRIVEELPEEAEQKTERFNVLINQILKIILNGISLHTLQEISIFQKATHE
jgi:hypothetical protein